MALNFQEFKELVKIISIGKQLQLAVYTHESAIETIPVELRNLIAKISRALQIEDGDWNLIKFYKKDYKISFLYYPEFDHYAYPTLKHSITVDLQKYSQRKADYSTSDNPPILHRKETFVSREYPQHQLFKKITNEGEDADLYTNTRKIGFKKNWELLISKKGLYLDDKGRLHQKIILPRDEQASNFDGKIERHKTAIERNKLSAPMQVLAKHNYLNGEFNVLDYGCGKGDDIRELEAHEIDCIGWDPVHQPENDIEACDLVNLGFVLNVIEDKEERIETLKDAFNYSNKLLIVSVMIAGESTISQFKPYKDGIITKINTFQKYYSQAEIKFFLETSLNESAIAVGQGLFIMFKDKIEEQVFLLKRHEIRRDWNQKSKRIMKTTKETLNIDVIDKNKELFDDYWKLCLELGRLPSIPEFEYSTQLRKIAGTHKKALESLKKRYGDNVFKKAIYARKCDLLVYFALGLFEKRKPYAQMPESLKRDIKVFFETYSTAIELANEALFSIGNTNLIEELAISSFQEFQIGEFEEGHHWTIHKSLLEKLPPELRIYIGCAVQYYGDMDQMDLIKIHFTSGKVTLLNYENWSKNEPLLVERIKIRLKDQEIEFYDYFNSSKPQILKDKQNYN